MPAIAAIGAPDDDLHGSHGPVLEYGPRRTKNAAKTRIKAAFTEILKLQFKPDLHHRGAWAAVQAPLLAGAHVAPRVTGVKLCRIAEPPRMARVSDLEWVGRPHGVPN